MTSLNPKQSDFPSEQLFDTEIPALIDVANVQDAFRVYHYGITDPANLPESNSQISGGVAGYLKAVESRVVGLESIGIGSSISSSTPPTGVADGYIWVDSASSPQSFATKSLYQNSAQTENLFEGMIWIDKDSSPLTMYVYDATSGWREIGA